MPRRKKTKEFKVGQIVRFTGEFLRNTGQFVGAPINGRVEALRPFGKEYWPVVLWSDAAEPRLVNPANIELDPRAKSINKQIGSFRGMTTRTQTVKRKLGGKFYQATWEMVGVVDGEPVSAANDAVSVVDNRVMNGVEPKGVDAFFDAVSEILASNEFALDLIPSLADSVFDPGFVDVTYRVEVTWWDRFRALPSEAKELARTRGVHLMSRVSDAATTHMAAMYTEFSITVVEDS